MTKNLINELEEFEKNNDYKEIIHTINQIISIKPELKEKLLLKRAIAYKELEAYEKLNHLKIMKFTAIHKTNINFS